MLFVLLPLCYASFRALQFPIVRGTPYPLSSFYWKAFSYFNLFLYFFRIFLPLLYSQLTFCNAVCIHTLSYKYMYTTIHLSSVLLLLFFLVLPPSAPLQQHHLSLFITKLKMYCGVLLLFALNSLLFLCFCVLLFFRKCYICIDFVWSKDCAVKLWCFNEFPNFAASFLIV